MNIIVIFNGLGNQMSQYAYYLAKKRFVPCKIIFDPRSKGHNGSELDRIFGINYPKGIRNFILQTIYRIDVNNKLKKLGVSKILSLFRINIIYEPRNYDYTPHLFEVSRSYGITFFVGGWHSEKNFLTIEREVRNVFKFPHIVDKECNRFEELIRNSRNSVSLHVRRGDYVNIDPDSFYQFGGVATKEYYKNAIAKLTKTIDGCTFFIFSNDIRWCREEFKGLNAFYVDCNTGKDSWRDMYLMTLCKHHIIANSTFSWWGAWLAEQDGITICPQRFIRTVETKDFYPDRWIKIEG